MGVQETIEVSSSGIEAARGKVVGRYVDNKFGHASALSTTRGLIWELNRPYTKLSAPTTLSFSSSSAEDASGGAEMLTSTIFGLNENYEEVSEVVTWTGQAVGTTVNQFIAFHRNKPLTGAPNVGNLYFYDDTGTATDGVPDNLDLIVGYVAAGDSYTHQCWYMVPANKTGYVTNYFASSFNNSNVYAIVQIDIQEFGAPDGIKRRFTVSRGSLDKRLGAPIVLPAKSIIQFTGASSSGTIDISASFDLQLLDD